MTRRAAEAVLLLAAGLAACSGSASSRSKAPSATSALDSLPPNRRDAALLGQEVFSLVDQAADYQGSHRGRPPETLRQMGVESLAPVFVRRIRVVSDSAVVTVAFRKPRGRTVESCEGNAEILEQATLRGGTFDILCTTPSGAISKYKVPAP
jgi:hypothetical protein